MRISRRPRTGLGAFGEKSNGPRTGDELRPLGGLFHEDAAMLIGHTLITRHPELRSMRRNASLAAIRQPRGPQRTKPETFAHCSIDLFAVAPLVGWQRHHCLMNLGINRQHAIDRLLGPLK